jgi:hypothetical protein
MKISNDHENDSETYLAKAKRRAIARLHRAEISQIKGDEKGLYRLYPGGRKEYIESPTNKPHKKHI